METSTRTYRVLLTDGGYWITETSDGFRSPPKSIVGLRIVVAILRRRGYVRARRVRGNGGCIVTVATARRFSVSLDTNQGSRRQFVATLAEASVAVNQFRAATGIGASDLRADFGHVYDADADGALVARVSYNGRLWALDGTEMAKGGAS